ncbi:MAG: zincin-like metallopeptidase domain-containing protein [Chloroflexota bacterium]|nr:zincin-like metallopeptidase domain-containing protein [Chloroflexota bacterium]
MSHELIHSTGDITHLKRERVAKASRTSTIKYTKEELVAEMGASFLAAMTGISTPELAGKNIVIKASSQAQKAVSYILGTTYA